MKPHVDLMILGDICPTADTRPLFDSADPAQLFGSLAGHLKRADVTVANLECVLSDTARGIVKIGPVLIGRSSDAQFLSGAGIDLLSLANNHVGDCGGAGVLDTIAACAAAGIAVTGAGANMADAAQPVIVEREGWKIGVIAAAEREFNAAGSNSPGAHIFDPLETLERVRALRSVCDYVIFLYHGGIEYYPYPSPVLQRLCRAVVRHGADLVLCQHSHCIGTRESYEGGEIVYGQGNTVYGYREGKPGWNRGLAVKLRLERQEGAIAAGIDYLPVGCDQTGRVDFLDDDEAKECLAAFAQRSGRLKDAAWLEQSWLDFCERLGRTHLPHVFGFSLLLTRVNRILRGALVRVMFSRRQKMIAMNVIRCDAHREAIVTALEKSLEGRRSAGRN
jgi:poly-gamma-glutamate synthesis protein (capsule biosynthesis protein)